MTPLKTKAVSLAMPLPRRLLTALLRNGYFLGNQPSPLACRL
jgi:hypothetical protein